MTAWHDIADAWVEVQDLLARTARPHELLLADAARTAGARTILDVGCGTGGTTLALARALGPDANITGIDVAAPMLAAARERLEEAARANDTAGVSGAPETSGAAGASGAGEAGGGGEASGVAGARGAGKTSDGAGTGGVAAVELVEGDAQTYGFERGVFDLVVSRCGVMFFADPAAAFANLRAATRAGGGLRMVVWRSAEENPFMTAAVRAARPVVGAELLPEPVPNAPGQFAFANERFLRGVLEKAGWADVELRELDTRCVFPEAQLMPYVTRVGAVANVLPRLDDQTRARVLEAVREAFAPFMHGGEVRYTACMWDVHGTNARVRGGGGGGGRPRRRPGRRRSASRVG